MVTWRLDCKRDGKKLIKEPKPGECWLSTTTGVIWHIISVSDNGLVQGISIIGPEWTVKRFDPATFNRLMIPTGKKLETFPAFIAEAEKASQAYRLEMALEEWPVPPRLGRRLVELDDVDLDGVGVAIENEPRG